MHRASGAGLLNYVSWKRRKEVAADLRKVYQAATEAEAERLLRVRGQLGSLSDGEPGWRRNWEHVRPFFAHPEEIRKAIYTTNAIESLNMSLRKIIKTRGSFPNEEAALKLLYLALRNAAKKWTRRLPTGGSV